MLRNAEDGHLAVITKNGRPAILAVPFDERFLEVGVHRALALCLFERRHLTLAQAATMAEVSVEGFLDLPDRAGASAVDYAPSELEEELGTILQGKPED